MLRPKKIVPLALGAALCLLLCASCEENGSPASDTPLASPSPAAESAAAPSATPDQEEGILYENADLGFSLTFPESWDGKYGILPLDDSIEVNHTQTREEVGEGNGLLFAIVRYSLTDDVDGMEVIATTEDAQYVVIYPADTGVTPTNASADEYLAMLEEAPSVVGTIRLLVSP
ncbi:MAG: hypothetical protein LUG13_00660 [Oscillospiraceae bacterium]|nr:hypothetical protein [Oscillospiraceae bacterium]